MAEVRINAIRAAALAVPLSWVAGAAQATDIAEMIAKSGRFQTFSELIQAAELTEDMTGEGPFTVFAPTDEAFAKLPAGTVENLLKPENKEKLKAVLTYHVVPGKVMAAQVTKMNSAKTVQGQNVRIQVTDGKVKVDEATVVKPDINASNGVIHVIDSVILPK